MKKKLIKRNKKKLSSMFKGGRLLFPNPEFTGLTYLGRGVFTANEGYACKGIVFCDEAIWSDD